jgi:enoyl-CoA hydratase/carnithine racemase
MMLWLQPEPGERMSEHIVISREGAVQIIRMNRPDKKNALTRAMYAAMAGALSGGDADPEVRAHVILGLPGAFSSGNDIADFMAAAMGGEAGTEVFDFLMALVRAEKPIVTGADGIAVGIGTTLHLHADLTFATPRTAFHTPFVDLGLVPEAGSTLIAPTVIGPQAAFALLALGEPLAAERAAALGLIHAVVTEGALESETLATARRIANKPPEALRIARGLMRGPRKALIARIEEEARHFRERLTSEEAKAAFIAFMNRKK